MKGNVGANESSEEGGSIWRGGGGLYDELGVDLFELKEGGALV